MTNEEILISMRATDDLVNDLTKALNQARQDEIQRIYNGLPNDVEIEAECDKEGYAPSSFTSGAGFVINRIEKLLSNE